MHKPNTSSQQALNFHEDSHSSVWTKTERSTPTAKTTTQAQVLTVLKRIPRESRQERTFQAEGAAL